MLQILLLEQSWCALYLLDISQNPQLLNNLLTFIEQSRDLTCSDEVKCRHICNLKSALQRSCSLDMDIAEYLFLKIIYFLKPGKTPRSFIFLIKCTSVNLLRFCCNSMLDKSRSLLCSHDSG